MAYTIDVEQSHTSSAEHGCNTTKTLVVFLWCGPLVAYKFSVEVVYRLTSVANSLEMGYTTLQF